MHVLQPEPSPDWDKLLMLLSADWAARFLPALHFTPDVTHSPSVRDSARVAVQSFVGADDTYACVDLSPERIARTHDLFMTLVARSLPATAVQELAATMKNVQAAGWRQTTTFWLISNVAHDLIMATPERLHTVAETIGPEAVTACRESWMQSDSWLWGLLGEAQSACRDASSAWDRQLRALTPELPSTLADYLQASAAAVGQWPYFCSLVERRLDRAHVDGLTHWLVREVARKAPQGAELEYPGGTLPTLR
jgi:hypothetical protein